MQSSWLAAAAKHDLSATMTVGSAATLSAMHRRWKSSKSGSYWWICRIRHKMLYDKNSIDPIFECRFVWHPCICRIVHKNNPKWSNEAL
jgi:hypothetical protein